MKLEKNMQNKLKITSISGNILNDIHYMCVSSKVIMSALKKGCDVAQLPNGDLIITEIKAINTQYHWDHEEQRLVKVPN